VDTVTQASIVQVGKISDDSAIVNLKANDSDGLVNASIVVDGQTINVEIPKNTKSIDINKTIEKLSENSAFEVVLEVV